MERRGSQSFWVFFFFFFFYFYFYFDQHAWPLSRFLWCVCVCVIGPGLSEDQVEKIVEQQKTKYQIEEEFDKFLRQVNEDGSGEGEDGKFV